jgi:hypothetical protein
MHIETVIITTPADLAAAARAAKFKNARYFVLGAATGIAAIWYLERLAYKKQEASQK